MAWESHLSARTGFSSSLIGSEVPAETERAEVVRCPRRPTTRTIPAYLRAHETTPDRIPTTPPRMSACETKKETLIAWLHCARRAAQTVCSEPITKGTSRAKHRTISRACLPRGLSRGLSALRWESSITRTPHERGPRRVSAPPRRKF